jgi:tetratricopeptide (TPR) repeat protein
MAMALPFGIPLIIHGKRCEARFAAACALGLELVFLAATRARGAWLGAALGLATVIWLERTRWRRQALVLTAAGALLAGIVASLPGRWSPRDAGDTKRYGGLSAVLEGSVDARSPALRTRLGLWRRTLSMTRDHPWIGVGPGNWPVAFPDYAEPNAARDGVLSPTLAPRQAHDDLLERAAETGIPGALTFLLLVAAAALAVRHRLQTAEGRARSVAASATGSLVALIVISLASFPLEMPGTITLTGLALGLIAAEPVLSAVRRERLAMPTILVASLLVVWTVMRAEVSVRSNLLFGAAERLSHRDAGAADATALLNRSLALHPAFAPELRAAQMWLREGHPPESIAASERALAFEPGSPNAWATLAAAQLAAEDFPGAIAAATHALGYVHDYAFALDVRRRAETKALDFAGAQRDLDQLIDLASHAEDQDVRLAARALMKGP